MPRQLRWLVFVAGFISLWVFATATTRADDPPGAKLFATYCAACHGTGGQNGFAPAVGSAAYLQSHDDQAIAEITRLGAPTKGMPAWAKAKGGNLTDEQIADIVAYLRAPTAAVPSVAPSSNTVTADDSVEYAQTNMTVTQSKPAEGGTVVTVIVKTSDGSPVVGAAIAFERVTSFGNLQLGTAKTDSSGEASLALNELPESGGLVDATFKGTAKLGSSAGRIALERPIVTAYSGPLNLTGVKLSIDEEPILAPEGSLITPNAPLLPTAIFALVVACVWATYGYVVLQLLGIFKHGKQVRRENTLRLQARRSGPVS